MQCRRLVDIDSFLVLNQQVCQRFFAAQKTFMGYLRLFFDDLNVFCCVIVLLVICKSTIKAYRLTISFKAYSLY